MFIEYISPVCHMSEMYIAFELVVFIVCIRCIGKMFITNR